MNEHIRKKTIALVVLSGGQDSTTCLKWAQNRYDEVHAITFDYGQRHAIELESAVKIAQLAGVESHEVVHLPESILAGTSPLVNADSEVEAYSSEADIPKGVAKTFVPVRNQFFLTLAANRAFVIGATAIVTGVCETDYSGYPDCRRDFIDSLEHSLNLGTFTGEGWLNQPISIETPLMYINKAQSVDLAWEEGAYPYLAFSHTAYDGSYPPKGTDAASIMRARGFLEAGVPDPLIIRAFNTSVLASYPDTENYSKEKVAAAEKVLRSSFGAGWMHV